MRLTLLVTLFIALVAVASAQEKCDLGTFSATGNRTSIQRGDLFTVLPCDPCPVGEYAGSMGATACLECAAGSYASNNGSSSCTQCLSGSYSSSGASTCQLCPLHSSSPSGSDSLTDCVCELGWVSSGSGTCIESSGSSTGTHVVEPESSTGSDEQTCSDLTTEEECWAMEGCRAISGYSCDLEEHTFIGCIEWTECHGGNAPPPPPPTRDSDIASAQFTLAGNGNGNGNGNGGGNKNGGGGNKNKKSRSDAERWGSGHSRHNRKGRRGAPPTCAADESGARVWFHDAGSLPYGWEPIYPQCDSQCCLPKQIVNETSNNNGTSGGVVTPPTTNTTSSNFTCTFVRGGGCAVLEFYGVWPADTTPAATAAWNAQLIKELAMAAVGTGAIEGLTLENATATLKVVVDPHQVADTNDTYSCTLQFSPPPMNTNWSTTQLQAALAFLLDGGLFDLLENGTITGDLTAVVATTWYGDASIYGGSMRASELAATSGFTPTVDDDDDDVDIDVDINHSGAAQSYTTHIAALVSALSIVALTRRMF